MTQVQKDIAALSFEERSELFEMLSQSVTLKQDDLGDAEDAELELAEKRDAELASGSKTLVSEEEFWQQVQRFKAAL
jgi:hypothetical protein